MTQDEAREEAHRLIRQQNRANRYASLANQLELVDREIYAARRGSDAAALEGLLMRRAAVDNEQKYIKKGYDSESRDGESYFSLYNSGHDLTQKVTERDEGPSMWPFILCLAMVGLFVVWMAVSALLERV